MIVMLLVEVCIFVLRCCMLSVSVVVNVSSVFLGVLIVRLWCVNNCGGVGERYFGVMFCLFLDIICWRWGWG